MNRKVVPILVALFVLITSACAPQASQNPIPETASTPTPSAAATAAVSQPATLTVLAAASLSSAFEEIGKQFESQHPGVNVEFSFAGSQQLAQQIAQGAPSDVFASANKAQMDAAIKSGRIDQSAPQTFARNRLVVIYPKENSAQITKLQDLAKAGIKIDLAAKEVPVGQYTLEFLDKASQDPAFGASFKEDVIKNVVSYEDNVKAVLTKVALNEVDAGVVYTTDAAAAPENSVGQLEIADALNVIASYPIAAINDSHHADLANAFVDYVLSPEGQEALAKNGFIAGAN